MSPDVLARMFDPFFTTKRVGEGTGLGLSVVHGIVSDLGGAIDVAAREGRGTVVSIWLPVGGESEPVLAAGPASNWPRGHGEVVMIVDDEEALVDLAEELLAELGYEPIGFSSGEQALRAFEADPTGFDAVLTDETMPGLLGTELAAALLAVRPDLPVLLMSGNVSQALEQRARAAKVQELLRKPLALQELADCLASVFAATERSNNP
jgi:CheY-like chemotaxis protein